MFPKFVNLPGETTSPDNNWKLLGELSELAGNNLPAALWPVSDRATSPSTVDARETFGRRFRRGRRPSPSAPQSETVAERGRFGFIRRKRVGPDSARTPSIDVKSGALPRRGGTDQPGA